MQTHRNSKFSLSRRALLSAAGVGLVGGLAPRSARAQAPLSESATLTLPGGQMVGATLYLPPKVPAPAVLMVHDRWGMTDVLRERAAALALDRYLVVAVDLYGGRLAQTAPEAAKMAQALDRPTAIATVNGWANWIRADARCTRNVGMMGFGLGGAVALEAAAMSPTQALVLYYALPAIRQGQVLRLNGPVLGHYSERDPELPVSAIEDARYVLQRSSKASRVFLYEADPDFANPASPQFARGDALLAWNRSVAFFRAHLGAGA